MARVYIYNKCLTQMNFLKVRAECFNKIQKRRRRSKKKTISLSPTPIRNFLHSTSTFFLFFFILYFSFFFFLFSQVRISPCPPPPPTLSLFSPIVPAAQKLFMRSREKLTVVLSRRRLQEGSHSLGEFLSVVGTL